MLRWFACLFCIPLVSLLGCQQEPAVPPAPPKAASSAAAVELKVLVVEDAPLSQGIQLLRGEWAERSGGSLSVEEKTLAECLVAEDLSADLVVYPSRMLGTFVARDWLRPLRDSLLKSDEVALGDQFPLIRDRVIRHGGQVYSLSLGEPPLMLVATSESISAGVPQMWNGVSIDTQRSAASLKFPLTAELLARAIAHAHDLRSHSLLFDPVSMTPRVDSALFQRALKEMRAAHATEAGQGKQPCWLGWPVHEAESEQAEYQFALLPRAEQVYDPLLESWVKNEDSQPLAILGWGGRLAGVSTSTRNSSSAFKLLRWLVSGQVAPQLSSRSHDTLWFRQSQINQASLWLKQTGASQQMVEVVQRLLTTESAYLIPRIPGIDEYLSHAEEFLLENLSKQEADPQALQALVEQWEQVTERLGREQQLTAYRQHLGLAESAE